MKIGGSGCLFGRVVWILISFKLGNGKLNINCSVNNCKMKQCFVQK